MGSGPLKGEPQDGSGVKVRISREAMGTSQARNGEGCTKPHPWEAQGRADRFRCPLSSVCRVSINDGLGLRTGCPSLAERGVPGPVGNEGKNPA